MRSVAVLAMEPLGGAQRMFEGPEAYERFMGRWSRAMAPQLVTFADLPRQARVLDVGCGTGALTEALLAAAPKSQVTGIDISEEYVAYAKQAKASKRAHFEVGDAQELSFPDHSFDATLSLLVINFIPDARKAVGEMARVVRRDGIVCAAVWDYGQGMEMLRWFWDAAGKLDPAAVAKDERNMPYCAKGELARLFSDCGLNNVQEKALMIPQVFHSFEDYWSPFLGGQGPAGAYVRGLNDDARDRLAGELRKRIAEQKGRGAFTLQAKAWAARGERSRG
jgi:SAM-dependent methyltransferase